MATIGTYKTPFYIKNDADEYIEVGTIEIPITGKLIPVKKDN